MFLALVFDAEVVNHEGEGDWAPEMLPQPMGVSALIVPMLCKALGKEVIGDAASLG